MDLSSFNLKRESDINRFRICYRFFAQAINYLDFLCYVKYTEFHHQIIRLTSRYRLSPETIGIPDIAFLIFLETHLLWATAGVNRPDGRRTAPTALNLQEIGVYVVTAKGAFSYRHEGHELVKLTDKNLMPLVAMQQDFVNTAPLALVYVGDLTKLPGERGAQMAAVDAGIAVQNALLYCSAAGLACVPRATMNVDGLAQALSLPKEAVPIMNVVVGMLK